MEEELIRFCAPTLAAIKSGCAFTYPYPEENALERKIHKLNRVLEQRGVLVLPLRTREGRALMYAFRPQMLSFDLSHEVARGVLAAYRYPLNNLVFSLLHLAERLEENRFPHEMGLFLGYPPMDVLGFILNEGAHYKKAGLWKVYGDEAEAQKRFALYKKCTAAYLCRYRQGVSLETLTVKKGVDK